ncbi:hypothetical protein [Actinomyces faecalis]|uniref:hypothetical protein n=1 Tax=Actinomyces faecalis TaxID=2722820 RepID=UPI001884D482|nr:hypothetical protein [Actinomyces faecalis]
MKALGVMIGLPIGLALYVLWPSVVFLLTVGAWLYLVQDWAGWLVLALSLVPSIAWHVLRAR